MSNTNISEFSKNDRITGSFLTTRKDLRQTKKGDPYLALQLTDQTGAIEARIWDDVSMLKQRFETGDVIKLQGRVDSFRDELQLIIEDAEKVSSDDIDLSRFMPSSRWSPHEMYLQLWELLDNQIEHQHLHQLVEKTLENEEIAEALKTAPAATHNHHNYVGGLLEHTLSMLRLSVRMSLHYNAYYPGLVDRSILLTGCLYHDIGKCRELKRSASFEYSDAGELTGHIVQGVEILNEINAELDSTVDKETLDQVKHLILSHHGELEYGSPVQPKTPEANLLHEIDVIDSRLNMCATAVSDHLNSESEDNWTSRVRPLNNNSLFMDGRWDGERESVELSGPGLKESTSQMEDDDEDSPNLELF